MTDWQQELECRDMVVRCLRSLDARNYDEVSASFAEDGIWERVGEKLVGPRAVREALNKRPADLQTQHLVSNMIVDAETESLATIHYMLTAYAQRGAAPFELHAILKAKDRVIKSVDGWRFLLRSATPAFASHA